ncbi:MAG: glycosyltransferase, partial [Chitinophagaceae bacterium]
TEKEKAALMKYSEALIIASLFESLSLVLLESFACKAPVIATAKTEVLKDHIEASGGGWLFDDYNSFSQALQQALTDEAEREKRGEAGYQYLLANYTWEKVLPQFDEAIESVEKENNKSLSL